MGLVALPKIFDGVTTAFGCVAAWPGYVRITVIKPSKARPNKRDVFGSLSLVTSSTRPGPANSMGRDDPVDTNGGAARPKQNTCLS
ncbi:hypothetical protein B0H14DRAFT_3488544 [Mycena olivaceomarginata]|nr:hypothetical protein B0H14DRAFT_3488544 [Mycena olivaceomarginata]